MPLFLYNVIRVRSFLKIMLYWLAAACGSNAWAAGLAQPLETGQVSDPQRPNIVLIMADDMGWGDTAYSSHTLAQTPNLDAMAAAGTVFSRAYSAAPVCSPTRGSVLTGRHPFRYGVYYANVGHLPSAETTLPEIMKTAGYTTGFFGKWHLGTLTKSTLDSNRGGRPEFVGEYSPPWLHGFDRVFSTESKTPTYDPMLMPASGDQAYWWNAILDAEEAKPFGTAYWNELGLKVEENLEGDDTRVIVDRVVPFIESSAASGTPFLAVIWAHAPHLPVVASEGDRAAIATDDPYTANYYGSIRAMDEQVGRVRRALEKAAVADNTIIWFTSDNGPEHKHPPAPGSNGGLRGTKRSLYEGGVRVPGIITYPGHIRAGRTLNAPVVTSDILPTVLDYLGLVHPNQRPLDGISLKPLLSTDSDVRGQAIGFESAHQISYVEDQYKLIYRPETTAGDPNLNGTAVETDRYSGQNPATSIRFELYDLLADPQESRDISTKQPKVLQAMLRELDVWRQSVAESISGKDYLVTQEN